MYDPNKCQSKKVQERLAALEETPEKRYRREVRNRKKAKRRKRGKK
jgi:hypothetical protein